MKLLLLVFAAIFVSATTLAQSTAERLDALFAPVNGTPYLHGGVLIAENGRVIYHRAFGHADVGARIPNTIHSRFQTASLSKVFTSTAILQLAGKRRLRLDEPVARHLPLLPFRDLTIRHLLTHTSGLPDLELFESLVATEPARIIRNSDVIPALRSWSNGLAFPPGTRFRYSNTNYQLLALIVERASGMSFDRYMERYVFRPAGMADTYIRTDRAVADPHRVRNHILPNMYDTTPVDVTQVNLADAVKMRRIRYETANLGATLGDQNVISTTLDVFRFNQALLRGTLLKPSLYAEATTPARLADGTIRYDDPGPPFATRCSYGLGWETCADMIGHSGYNRGIASMLYYDPDRQQTIVMFDNADAEDFGRKIASIVNVINGKPPLEVDRRISVTREYGRTLLERGPAAALIAYNRMRADALHYTGGTVRGMNILGYDLLRNGYVAEALEPFRINVVLHPNDANVYDSYGEALAANGRTTDSIAMYERSLELNPQNDGARRALEQLRGVTHSDGPL